MANSTKIPKLPQLPHGEGTMTLKEKANHRYEIMYRKMYKGKRLTVYADTASEAMSKMRDKEKEEDNEIFTKTVSITLRDDIQDWLTQIKANQLKPKSYDRIETTFRNQIYNYEIGKLRVSNVSDRDLQAHIDKLVQMFLNNSTIYQIHDIIFL